MAHVRNHVADFAGTQHVGLHLPKLVVSDLLDVVHLANRAELDLHAGLELAIHDAHAWNRAAVAVVHRIEDQCAKRSIGVAFRWRHAKQNLFQQGGDTDPFLGTHAQDSVRRDAEQIDELLAAPFRFSPRKIDLVEYRNNFEASVHRQEQIGQRLRLDSLRRVDNENRALARRERARDFISEVHVTRRVDEVELVLFAVRTRVAHPHGIELDRDPALALQIERVEHLGLHLPPLKRSRCLDQTVCERGFSMIDMGDDTEIADVLELHSGLWGDFRA